MLNCLMKTSDRYLLKLICKPAQAKTSIRKIDEDFIHVHIAAAAVDGKANDELLEFMSWLTDVDHREVKLLAGHTSKYKTVSLRSGKDYSSMLRSLRRGIE